MKKRILVVTTLYPNQIQFRHGIFVETRIKKLHQTGELDVTVIAPVPWFPFKTRLFHNYSKLVDIPVYEDREGIEVYHPRYLVIPKIGMLMTPFFLALSIFLQAIRLKNNKKQFDLIDCHYYYPDGIAAAMVSKLLKLPIVITARGTDINLIPDFFFPRKMILWASHIASVNISVCEALRQRMIEIGVRKESTIVFRNGVDLDLFAPMDRESARERLKIRKKLLISVGYLIERKGHHYIIEAMKNLPDFHLFIVGDGEWREKLKTMVKNLELEERISFLGERRQNELVELYNCADALVLASSREGWANVLLESLACGTPVVATNIWGTPEVVAVPEAGVLCSERTAKGIEEGVLQLFNRYPDRKKTREYAEQFSWQSTTNGILNTFNNLTNIS